MLQLHAFSLSLSSPYRFGDGEAPYSVLQINHKNLLQKKNA